MRVYGYCPDCGKDVEWIIVSCYDDGDYGLRTLHVKCDHEDKADEERAQADG